MTPPSRFIGAGASNITTTDNILNIDTTLGAAVLTLPSIATWFDLKNKSGSIYDADGLRFTDVSGTAGTNNITFVAASGDNVNGESNIIIDTNGASGVLTPNLENGEWEFSLVGAAGGAPNSTIFGGSDNVIALPTNVSEIIANGVTKLYGKLNIYNNGLDYLKVISFPDLKEAFTGFYIDGVNVESILFERLENLTADGIYLTNLPLLTELNFNKLKKLIFSGGSFVIYGDNSLTTLSFPSLTDIEGYISSVSFSVSNCTNLSSIDFSKLENADTLNLNISIGNLPSCTSIDFSKLTKGNIDSPCTIAIDSVAVTSLSFPSLISNFGLYISNCSFLTSVSFPLLEDMESIFVSPHFRISSNPLLTEITIGAVLNSTNFDFSNNALTQVNVDDILAKIDGAGQVNGGLNLSGGTNATPSAAGLVSKSNLESKGWLVTTN